jgi:hypothetical protein
MTARYCIHSCCHCDSFARLHSLFFDYCEIISLINFNVGRIHQGDFSQAYAQNAMAGLCGMEVHTIESHAELGSASP